MLCVAEIRTSDNSRLLEHSEQLGRRTLRSAMLQVEDYTVISMMRPNTAPRDLTTYTLPHSLPWVPCSSRPRAEQ